MQSDPSLNRTQKLQVATGAGVVAVAYGMARFGLGLSTPRIIEDQVATEAQIGIASSLSFTTYVIACFISGALLNKSRWKASILLVLATAVVGCLLVATAVNAPMFLAGIGIGGAAAGFTSGAIAYRLVRDLPTPVEPRSQALANAGAGIGVALATALLLFTTSWRSVFLAAAVLAVVLCLGFIRTSRGVTAQRFRDETPGAPGRLVVPVLLTMLMGAGSSVYWTYGRALVEEQAKLSAQQSLLFWGAIGVSGVAGSFSGDAATKLGTKISWAACSVLLGASILLLPFLSGIALIVISGAVFGAFYTILCGLTIELARESWPTAVGAATSILFATIAVGQAVGSLLNGLMATVAGFPVLFVVGGVSAMVGCALVWVVPSRQAALQGT
ncbi:MFS transporter [Kocuria marina]|uniref:MFS transporter n=1 Tax=Kocuria marina TaxID=223184 RepID=UPI0022E1AB02|nr:MFS transporter [Kocuria marina]